MSRFARDLYRKRLHKFLGAAPAEGFLELIWAADALQTGHEASAAKVLGRTYPADAITSDMSSQHKVHKWELETLANELLAAPDQPIIRGEQTKTVDCRNYRSLVTSVNLLRALENHECGASSKPQDILREMYRIAGRQFDWQRGYFNIPLFYHSAFIYEQGRCADYLTEAYSTSLAEMSFVVFALHTLTTE